ncbi:MAG: NAD(P)H-dependent oxidoreductase subunit E [Aristaeellaceae bacterium]
MTQLLFDSGKLRIRVCCGMNCAGSGGGRPLEEALQCALDTAHVADQVELLRAHCLGECQHGPCVRMAGERFYHVQAEDVPDLVRNEILPRLK